MTRITSAITRNGVLADGPRRRFAAVSFIDSLGTGLFLPMMVLFFTRSAGLTAGQVGLGLTLAGITALVVTPAAGRMLDRYDPRLTLVPSYGIRAAVYAAYAAVHSVIAFIPLVCLAQASAQVGRSARTILVAGLTSKEERVPLLAGVSTIRNFGVGLGSLGAGVALAEGTRAAYLAVVWLNAASYLLGGLLVWTMPATRPRRQERTEERGSVRAILRNRRFTSLAALNAVLLVNDAALVVAVPIWLTTKTAAPAALTGLLFTLNTLLVVLLQVVLSRTAKTLHGAGRAYLFGGLAFLLGCSLFVLAATGGAPLAVILMIAGVTALTITEIFSVAAGWAVSLGLAPSGQQGRYIAVFSLGEGAATSAGPALVMLAVVQGGGAGWLALGAASGLAGALAWRLCRAANDQVPEPSA